MSKFPWHFVKFPDNSLTLRNFISPWHFPDGYEPWLTFKWLDIFFMWFHFLMLLCITLIFSDERGANQATSHYLNQCWNIVNSNLRNTLQWNLQRNSYHFIQENAFEMVVWNLAAILSRPQCVNKLSSSDATNLFKKLTNQIVTMACKVSAINYKLGPAKTANILQLHSKYIFLRGNFYIL